ncbi:hypothetical protein ANO11243_058570 [Dothideomycetidae sp. 11243]|nr:hypothetical protein ANO11243_058570 [fungal sp. No.11243]
MSRVPDGVLSWLWAALQAYSQPRLIYNDAAAALSQFPSLKPKTAVYTYEDGQTALLLCIFGTLAVEFRAAEYRYPVEVWVPHSYGERGAGVICYVRATTGSAHTPSTTAIRPGQHVAMDGRIYHPYLRDWNIHERSNIVDFLQIVKGIFAREPPLVAKTGVSAQGPARTGMQIPALPPKVRTVQTPSVELPTGPPSPRPPPLPSKPGKPETTTPGGHGNTGPPLPPLPHEAQSHRDAPKPSVDSVSNGTPLHMGRNGFASSSRHATAPPLPPLPLPPRFPAANHEQSPISPLSPTQHAELPAARAEPPYMIQQPDRMPQNSGVDPRGSATPMHAHMRTHPQQLQSHAQGYQPQYQKGHAPGHDRMQPYNPTQYPLGAQSHAPNTVPLQQSQAAKRAAPALDLLTDPFDISLGPTAAPGPAPPIPPNPEKEHLLQLLSESLVAQATAKIQQSQSAMAPLTAQRQALLEAQSRLQSEIHQLQSLDIVLTTNEKILHQSIRDCQSVIEASRKMPEPNIDEVLVAPTVAAQQLWNLCAEEVAIKEAMYSLQRGVGAGRVSSAEFVRLTRSLARECFLKMALARKVATGLGLEVQGYARQG